MANIGKRILSAFVEVTDDKSPVKKPEETNKTSATSPRATVNSSPPADNSKFRQYFDKLFEEANIPGPDYFEFSKMVEAMAAIPDEKARFSAAFAGLKVQGLDRRKLLSTAGEYLNILDKDAGNFLSTVDATIQEKVYAKRKEMEQKEARIQQLTKEITDLHNEVAMLTGEIKENEEKIEQSTGGYKNALEAMKSRIAQDIEKIKIFIQ